MTTCFSSSSSTTTEFHQVITSDSVSDIKKYLENTNQQTICLIDIDSTLTMPSDPYLQRQAIQKYKNVYNDTVKNLKPNQLRIFNHLLTSKSPSQLVESEWPDLINQLMRNEIRTLAFTASSMEVLGYNGNRFADWRYAELKRLGIDFLPSYPDKKIFKDLKDLEGEHPGIEKGIVYIGHHAKKGDLLKPVFDVLQQTPSHLVVVDDKIDNINHCMDTLEKEFPNMSYLGIHYTGVDHLFSDPTKSEQADEFEKNMKEIVEKITK